MALRPRFTSEFRERATGFQRHSLYSLEGGDFLDIALWSAASDLDAVDETQGVLVEWYDLVEIVSMELADVLDE
ncbi:hypothetical protein [Aeromicrobium sp. 9AM]|uniref:hypothetical protein n=1 Tax=Aeromicrobium sp. 9AM TaxID=2653126 RepID=UPI0013597185|nr:hypothetical protein [Aeromicrobium sp. 9AM]